MKKSLFFIGVLACCIQSKAQVVIPQNGGPVKLTDVVALYKKMHPDYANRDFVKALLPGIRMERSEKDFQFERWVWYWKQHLDNNGYLVSPAQTMLELDKAKQEQKGSRVTSGVSASWTFVGPDSSDANGEGVGRVNMIAFHPTDVNTYWVATPGGGAWKTTNNGGSWTCMTDQLPTLALSDIVFNPLNPNTIYLCSGDRDAGDYTGVGVLKSYDGGAHWLTTGMAWSASQYYVAKSMLVNPLDTNSLIVATNTGIYRSYNGGTTFTQVATGDFEQLLYRPNDTNVVYATNYMSYYPVMTKAQIWRSADGGTTWAQQTSLTNSIRINLAVTPAAPNMVLAISTAIDSPSYNNYAGLDGIYKSSDTGKTFNEIYNGGCTGNLLTWDVTGNSCGGQGWYTLPLAISPVDSNVVYTGGVNAWWSSDGGVTWTLATEESPDVPGVAIVHADKHWMAFHPLMPGRLFEANDGGIYSSDNPIATGVWNNLTNRMGIEEIYRMSVSNVATFAITGAQDNGSKIIRSGGLFEDAYWDDGMTCRLDTKDSTVAYASGQGGVIARLDPTNPTPITTAVDISANIAGGSVEGNGAWTTPFIITPSCNTCLLAGYQSIYMSNDRGNTWSTISGALTSGNLERVVTTMADSATIFATEDQNGSNTTIHYTHDGGTTWSTLTAPFSGGGQYITDIKVDPRDKNHIWLTFGGYGGARVVQWSPSTGFQTFNNGLPGVPVMCIAVDYLSRDLYVGTEIGVYYRDSTMTNWAPFTTGMPSVMVTDMDINYTTNTLWAATYGRSLWQSPKHTTTVLPNSVPRIVPFANDGITISPNPNNGNFTVTVKNEANKQVAMSLINGDGKTVWQGNGAINGNKVDVHTTGLTAGTYIFEIASQNVIIGRQKVVIL